MRVPTTASSAGNETRRSSRREGSASVGGWGRLARRRARCGAVVGATAGGWKVGTLSLFSARRPVNGSQHAHGRARPSAVLVSRLSSRQWGLGRGAPVPGAFCVFREENGDGESEKCRGGESLHDGEVQGPRDLDG